MAFCANCGREIDASAAACPECGHPTGAFVHTASLAYAGFWTRFAAVFIDGLILLIPSLILGFGHRFGGTVVNFLYDWLLIAYWNGQTVGKRALGVRVARPDGSPVDLGVAAARAGMKIVSGLALGLGFLWAAWDPQKRTWHDMVADTRVFRV
jgi:uncharacterized RDD family membrane protein YckC